MTKPVKTVLKWLLLILLLAYSVGMCVWAYGQSRARLCRGVTVNILSERQTMSKKTIEEQVFKCQRIKGLPVSEVDTRKIEKYLKNNNNFEEVEVAMTSGGYLQVNVIPLIPELRVFTPRGSYYVNRTGKRVDASADFFVDVPVVRGNFTSRFRPVDLLPVVDYVKKDSLLTHLVSMIDARGPEDIILVPRIKGHVINIGNSRNLKDKFQRLLLMYRKVMPYKGWNTYDTVSVKFNKMIVCTRRNKAIPIHGSQDLSGDSIEEENLNSLEFRQPDMAQETSVAKKPESEKKKIEKPKKTQNTEKSR